MSDTEKDLTYEEAKELCKKAFYAGVDYEGMCLQYNCNAIAYDWKHWLKENERLFMPTPSVEDVLREFADEVQRCCDTADTISEYAAKLRLADE